MIKDVMLWGLYVSLAAFLLGVLMIIAEAANQTIGRSRIEIQTELEKIRAGTAAPRKAPLGLKGVKLSRIAFVSVLVFLVLHFIV